MKYAVVSLSGSQYKVEENQVITVDNLNLKEGEKSTTDQVLLTVDGDKVTIGTPNVAKATVEFEIAKNYKDDKIKVFKYKSKSRYRRTNGFRAQVTDIKITKLNF